MWSNLSMLVRTPYVNAMELNNAGKIKTRKQDGNESSTWAPTQKLLIKMSIPSFLLQNDVEVDSRHWCKGSAQNSSDVSFPACRWHLRIGQLLRLPHPSWKSSLFHPLLRQEHCGLSQTYASRFLKPPRKRDAKNGLHGRRILTSLSFQSPVLSESLTSWPFHKCVRSMVVWHSAYHTLLLLSSWGCPSTF